MPRLLEQDSAGNLPYGNMRGWASSLPGWALLASLLFASPAFAQDQGGGIKKKIEKQTERAKRKAEKEARRKARERSRDNDDKNKDDDDDSDHRENSGDEDEEGEDGRHRHGRRINWAESLESAVEESREEGERPLVVFVHPVEKPEPPEVFRRREFVRASREQFVFVRIPYDPENLLLVRNRIRKHNLPYLLGLDAYLNPILQSPALLAPERLRGFLKTLEKEARKLAERVRDLHRRAAELEENGVQGARLIRALREAADAAEGYPEVMKARRRIQELGLQELKGIEKKTAGEPRAAEESLKEVVRVYRRTPIELEARLRLASVLHGLGEVRSAFEQLKRLRMEGVPEDMVRRAGEMWLRFRAEARSRLVEILEKGLNGEARAAEEELRRLKETYRGTDFADAIRHVLRDLAR